MHGKEAAVKQENIYTVEEWKHKRWGGLKASRSKHLMT